MAVIKLKYTKSRRKIKAHVRYITHRPTREGERHARPLFDRGGAIDKTQAYKLIDQSQRGPRFYKLIISPDPRTEDTGNALDLWQIAKQTLSALEDRLKRQLSFLGVLHADHSANRHVHLVFTHSGRLSRLDIRALREAATIASGGQLRERQRFSEQSATRQLRIRLLPAQSLAPRPKASPRPMRLHLWSTRFCATCLTLTTQLSLPGNRRFCQSCRTVQGIALNPGQSQEAEWTR
jgi:hypothetical protein